MFPTEFYYFTPKILTFFLSLPQSPHTAQGDRTAILLPGHCAAAFLNKKLYFFPILKAFFSPASM